MNKKPLWLNNGRVQRELFNFSLNMLRSIILESSIRSQTLDQRLLRKIKSIKFTKDIQLLDHFTTNQRGKIINVFQHQRKNVIQTNLKDSKILRHYPQISKAVLNTSSYQSWRTFLYSLEYHEVTIELVKLYSQNNVPLESKLKRYLHSRLWHHLDQLQHLNQLTISLSNTLTLDMIDHLKKLSTSSSLLDRLSTLTVCLNHLDLLNIIRLTLVTY